jgi:hypothetical protein
VASRESAGRKASPSVGVIDTLRDTERIVGLIDARAPKPGPRYAYKKEASISP